MALVYSGRIEDRVAMQIKGTEKQDNKMDAFRVRKREIQCALNLIVEKLQPYISNTHRITDSGANDKVIPIGYVCM